MNTSFDSANATRFSFLQRSNTIIFVTFLVLVTALIVDTLFTRTGGFIFTSDNLSLEQNVSFTLIAIASIGAQILVLEFVRLKGKQIIESGSIYPRNIYRFMRAIQYGLSAILLITVADIISTSHYRIAYLIVAMTLSYSFGGAMMVLLSKHFFSWYKPIKDVVILLYGISSAILALHLFFTLGFIDSYLSGLPAEIYTQTSIPPYFVSGSLGSILNNIYEISSILSFVAMWAATAMLLRHYSKTLGNLKYWFIMSIPLGYFLGQYVALFLQLFSPLIRLDPIFYATLLTSIFTLSKPIGGILFGIAFWAVSRNLHKNTTTKDYLVIAALGFILLFTSDQGIVLIYIHFPPFGLTTISFVGLSSSIILIGIYYCAISISQDVKLRKEIKRFAIENSRLLDEIGSAQREYQIQKLTDRVERIMMSQDSIVQRTGIQSSLEDKEIIDYLDEVLKYKKEIENKNHDAGGNTDNK